MVLPFLKPPAIVILYLQAPRERYWGVVRALDATGVVLQGTDLDSFDDWVRQVASGEPNQEPSTVFFPLHRVERVFLDESAGDFVSFAERFKRSVGEDARYYLTPIPEP